MLRAGNRKGGLSDGLSQNGAGQTGVSCNASAAGRNCNSCVVRIGPCIDLARDVEGTARARRTALLADLQAHIQALLVRERAHHGPKPLRKTLTNLF